MFDSITDLADKLAATGYFIDPVMTQVVFLAAKLQKDGADSFVASWDSLMGVIGSKATALKKAAGAR